jgi:hypothetical protein
MNTMHLEISVAIRPNLELKTRPKQLLGSLPLVIALPALTLPNTVMLIATIKVLNIGLSSLGHFVNAVTNAFLTNCIDIFDRKK